MTLGARGSGSAQGRTGPGAVRCRGPLHIYGTSSPPLPQPCDIPLGHGQEPSGHMPHGSASHANGRGAAIPHTESWFRPGSENITTAPVVAGVDMTEVSRRRRGKEVECWVTAGG